MHEGDVGLGGETRDRAARLLAGGATRALGGGAVGLGRRRRARFGDRRRRAHTQEDGAAGIYGHRLDVVAEPGARGTGGDLRRGVRAVRHRAIVSALRDQLAGDEIRRGAAVCVDRHVDGRARAGTGSEQRSPCLGAAALHRERVRGRPRSRGGYDDDIDRARRVVGARRHCTSLRARGRPLAGDGALVDAVVVDQQIEIDVRCRLESQQKVERDTRARDETIAVEGVVAVLDGAADRPRFTGGETADRLGGGADVVGLVLPCVAGRRRALGDADGAAHAAGAAALVDRQACCLLQRKPSVAVGERAIAIDVTDEQRALAVEVLSGAQDARAVGDGDVTVEVGVAAELRVCPGPRRGDEEGSEREHDACPPHGWKPRAAGHT